MLSDDTGIDTPRRLRTKWKSTTMLVGRPKKLISTSCFGCRNLISSLAAIAKHLTSRYRLLLISSQSKSTVRRVADYIAQPDRGSARMENGKDRLIDAPNATSSVVLRRSCLVSRTLASAGRDLGAGNENTDSGKTNGS